LLQWVAGVVVGVTVEMVSVAERWVRGGQPGSGLVVAAGEWIRYTVQTDCYDLNLTVKNYENWSTSDKVLPFGARESGNYDSPCSSTSNVPVQNDGTKLGTLQRERMWSKFKRFIASPGKSHPKSIHTSDLSCSPTIRIALSFQLLGTNTSLATANRSRVSISVGQIVWA